MAPANTHSLMVGYILWIFGFMGAHRFYYGRPATGTLYFFTLGLLFVGWVVDLFLMATLDREADHQYVDGKANYTIAWILLTFLGVFGAHRFYLRKWGTGFLWMFTGGLFLAGYLYDLWNLNEQVDDFNRESGPRAMDFART